MKTKIMLQQENIGTSSYVGDAPEDVLIRIGEEWIVDKTYVCTEKTYKLLPDVGEEKNRYTVEAVFSEKATTEPASARKVEVVFTVKNDRAFPEVPGTEHNPAYMFPIAIGDHLTDRSNQTALVLRKYYRPMSGGRLTIGYYLG